MKKILLIFSSFIISIIPAIAQQDPIISQYYSNLLYIIPGYAGRLPLVGINFLNRSFISNNPHVPVVNIFNCHGRINHERMGIGLQLAQESFHDFNNTSVKFFYSYKIKLASGIVSTGIEAGVGQYKLLYKDLAIRDKDDELLNEFNNAFFPDFGFGVFYYNKKVEWGISIKHLNKPLISVSNQNNPSDRLRYHYYFYGKYNVKLSENFYLYPSFLLKYVNGAPAQADLTILPEFTEKLWFGLTYRTSNQMIFQAGYYLSSLSKNINSVIKLGYAYEMNLNSRKNQPTSHELLLIYNFKVRPNPEKLRKRSKISSPLFF